MDDKILAGTSNSVVDFCGREWRFDCMGCAVVGGVIDLPGGKAYESDSVVLATDPAIPIPGFLIVNSKRHIKSFADLTEAERHEMVDVVAAAEKALRELGIAQEFTIVQEERSPHFHIWIFPYSSWMEERFGKGVTHLRAILDYAKENSTSEIVQETIDAVKKVKTYFDEHGINA